MLLAVATTFIIIRLPYIVCYYIDLEKRSLFKDLDGWKSLTLYTLKTVTYVIAVINYAINFFLYCLSGSLFRKQFRSLLCKLEKLDRQDHSTTSKSFLSDTERNYHIMNSRVWSSMLWTAISERTYDIRMCHFQFWTVKFWIQMSVVLSLDTKVYTYMLARHFWTANSENTNVPPRCEQQSLNEETSCLVTPNKYWKILSSHCVGHSYT